MNIIHNIYIPSSRQVQLQNTLFQSKANDERFFSFRIMLYNHLVLLKHCEGLLFALLDVEHKSIHMWKRYAFLIFLAHTRNDGFSCDVSRLGQCLAYSRIRASTLQIRLIEKLPTFLRFHNLLVTHITTKLLYLG